MERALLQAGLACLLGVAGLGVAGLGVAGCGGHVLEGAPATADEKADTGAVDTLVDAGPEAPVDVQPEASLPANPLGCFYEAWGMPAPEIRAKLLARCWAGDGAFYDATTATFGQSALVKEIGNFLAVHPGAQFLLPFDNKPHPHYHHDRSAILWEVRVADEKIFSGVDFVNLPPDGRFTRVVRFVDPRSTATPPAAVVSYVKAWGITDEVARKSALQSAMTSKALYLDYTDSVVGPDAVSDLIAKRQKKDSFQLEGSVTVHPRFVRFHWHKRFPYTLGDGQSGVGLAGLDSGGKMTEVITFPFLVLPPPVG